MYVQPDSSIRMPESHLGPNLPEPEPLLSSPKPVPPTALPAHRSLSRPRPTCQETPRALSPHICSICCYLCLPPFIQCVPHSAPQSGQAVPPLGAAVAPRFTHSTALSELALPTAIRPPEPGSPAARSTLVPCTQSSPPWCLGHSTTLQPRSILLCLFFQNIFCRPTLFCLSFPSLLSYRTRTRFSVCLVTTASPGPRTEPGTAALNKYLPRG